MGHVYKCIIIYMQGPCAHADITNNFLSLAFLVLTSPHAVIMGANLLIVLDLFQAGVTSVTSIRWQKWFMETSQMITVMGQIDCHLCCSTLSLLSRE